MNSLIRLALLIGAVLAIAPVAGAQCVVDPKAVDADGAPCVEARTPADLERVRGQRPAVQDVKPTQKLAPVRPIPAPQVAKPRPGNLIKPGLAPPFALKP